MAGLWKKTITERGQGMARILRAAASPIITQVKCRMTAHLQIRVHNAARVFMRGHAAGAGGVLDIARLIKHKLIQRVIGQCGSLCHG
jgi:hypothetical protein